MMVSIWYVLFAIAGNKDITIMVKFRCNFCSANTEFMWLDQYQTATGFRVFQCLKCCAVGTKNLAEATDTQEPVIRCEQCGSWQFVDQQCHTCALVRSK